MISMLLFDTLELKKDPVKYEWNIKPPFKSTAPMSNYEVDEVMKYILLFRKEAFMFESVDDNVCCCDHTT